MTKTHGFTGTKTHRIWVQMRRRCRDPRAAGYNNYGGRGIQVCERWDKSFEAFLADMGECPPGMSIERKKNDLGYSPENCVWATQEEQNNNRRNNVFLEHEGKRMTIRQWSRELGIKFGTLHTRYRQGLSVPEILSAPKFQKGVRKIRETKKQQPVIVDGATKSLRQAALDAGLNYTTVYRRMRSGLSIEDALIGSSRKTGAPL